MLQITFNGESGIDAGGVFREGVSRIVEDIFSEHFNLFILCPNGVHKVHVNTEMYLPNPDHIGSLALKMFEFTGKLMGMSLRAKLDLPFELPPLIWKKLIGESVSLEDLMGIDVITAELLRAIRTCEDDGITSNSEFEMKYEDKLKFVYTSSGGVLRELVPGGRVVQVSFDNRLEYCQLVENARLSEFDRQVAAMQQGLSEVVPLSAIQLFTSQQVELLVSGCPIFDIDLWKQRTDSSGVPPKTLSLFWKVIESLSAKDQAGFVRFAWGRSRLPGASEFTTKMRLTSAGSAKLPVAHTCFFSVELPDYGTEDDMRHGLLTAVNFGVGGILMG